MSTINPTEYPSNSQRSKTTPNTQSAPTEKRVKKVVKAPVTIKQKSEARKFLENFISEDVVNVKDYLVKDIVIPTIKDTIWAVITNSVEMVLFGGTGRARRGGSTLSSRRSSDYVSYSSYSSDRRDSRSYRDRREEEETSRSRFDPEDIIFKHLDDAEAVLDQMAGVIETYGKVTVNDLYDMVDRTPPYTAARYGWTYLDGNCKPVRVRDGYILKLPKARPI